MNNMSSFFLSNRTLYILRVKHYTMIALALFVLLFLQGCDSEAPDVNSIPAQTQADTGQINMFDGKTLGKWQISDFYNPGKVFAKDGAIYIEKSETGGYMQGINWTGPLEKMNYEITLEAMRVEGNDFFCGLTFPVGESPCTLILGGWGGTLCGLSSLDNYDASENETTTFYDFIPNQWYKVRLRVTPNRIQAWIDWELLVDVDTTDKFIDIRIECMPSLPLGIATYQTTGAIRNIKLEKIKDPKYLNLDFEL